MEVVKEDIEPVPLVLVKPKLELLLLQAKVVSGLGAVIAITPVLWLEK